MACLLVPKSCPSDARSPFLSSCRVRRFRTKRGNHQRDLGPGPNQESCRLARMEARAYSEYIMELCLWGDVCAISGLLLDGSAGRC